MKVIVTFQADNLYFNGIAYSLTHRADQRCQVVTVTHGGLYGSLRGPIGIDPVSVERISNIIPRKVKDSISLTSPVARLYAPFIPAVIRESQSREAVY